MKRSPSEGVSVVAKDEFVLNLASYSPTLAIVLAPNATYRVRASIIPSRQNVLPITGVIDLGAGLNVVIRDIADCLGCCTMILDIDNPIFAEKMSGNCGYNAL